MRFGPFFFCLFVLCLTLLPLGRLPGQAATKGSRYGIAPDQKSYPQSTAREALASVLKAIDDKKMDYLVAQLADPAFVDDRVKRIYGGKFAEQVTDTASRLDSSTVKQLKRFLKEGKWTVDKSQALVQLEDVKDRAVRLIQKDGRWYLEHRSAAPER
jgi:hypothetical protein